MEKTYETVVMLNDEDIKQYEDCINRISNICQTYTGEQLDIEVSRMGSKKLAYEIRGHTTGYYVVIHWKGTNENQHNLEKYLRLDDTVIKYITITNEEIELKPHKAPEKKIIDILDIIYNIN